MSWRSLVSVSRSAILARTLVVAAAVGLAACSSQSPETRAFPTISFSHKAPIVFAAQGPRVESQFTAPMRDPHVEHLMPLAPEEAIRIWARDRLKGTGVGDGEVRVIIRDASVVEKILTKKAGVVGFFTDDQEVQYDARAVVAVQYVNTAGKVVVESEAIVDRSRTINEKASLHEREKIWFAMIESMVTTLDEQMSQGLPQYFAPYILSR